MTAEAEKAVIGALLLDPSKVREAVQNVAPGDFESPVLGRLYALITGRQASRLAIDPIALLPAIAADEVLSRNLRNPAVSLHELREATPTASNIAYYARQVQEAGQARRLRIAAQQFERIAGDPRMSSAEKLSAARKELDHIASDYAQAVEVPTLAEVLATPDEEVEWVIPEFLGRRDRFVLTGEEGFGKTTLFRQIMICAAAGIHPFSFTRMKPATVLVVDTENSEEQWRWETRKMAALGAHYGERNPAEAIRLHCTGRLDINQERDFGLVHSLLDQYQPDILAIGPLYKLSPKGLNSDEDANPVLAALDSIRDRPDGPAMLMEAHAGNASGGDGERALRPRGSSAQRGWPEFGIGITPDLEDETGTVAKVKRWRFNRIRGRHIPTHLRSGGEWPWMEDGAAQEWLRIKSERMRETA